MRKLIQIFLFLICCVFSETAQSARSVQQPASSDSSTTIEHGKFTLHKFEQSIGEETYENKRDRDSLSVTMDFKFTDRGSPVPLATTFRSAPDLTPQAFEIKGKTARPVSIDEALTVDGATVHFRTPAKTISPPVPSSPFFTIASYAPTTMQMLMVRYWATHGSPAQLATLPSGTVRIEPRGQDTIHLVVNDASKDPGKPSQGDAKIDR